MQVRLAAPVVLAMVIGVVLSPAWAGDVSAKTKTDIENGKILVELEGCIDCHGLSGMTLNRLRPHLCGQHQAYLFKQLLDIRLAALGQFGKGRLGGRWSSVPGHDIPHLTVDDLQDMAAYYAACPPPFPLWPPAERPRIANRCVLCHGKGGRSRIPTVPKLAAQKAPYLVRQMEYFRRRETCLPSGEQVSRRSHPMMCCESGLLTDRQIDALAAWYAGQDYRK